MRGERFPDCRKDSTSIPCTSTVNQDQSFLFISFINIPCSEGILLGWVTGGFVIGPAEFAGGWLFINSAPV